MTKLVAAMILGGTLLGRFPNALAAEAELTPAEETMRLGLIDEANSAHAAGEHEHALAAGRKALKLKRTPSLELFIAKEAKELNDYGVAYEESRLCLVAAKRDTALHSREKIISGCAAVQEAVKDLVGYVVLRLDHPPEGLSIKIGGEELSAAALGNPYVVTPGSIVIDAEAPAYGKFHAEIKVTSGAKQEIDVALTAPESPRAPQDTGPSEVAAVHPATPPPQPIPESQPPSPSPSYVWTQGSWDWNGSDWFWTSGYWAPPSAGFVYVEPRYVIVDSRPVYYRGYWRDPSGAPRYVAPHGPPPMAWRGQPRVAPQVWRAQPEHRTWRTATVAPPSGPHPMAPGATGPVAQTYAPGARPTAGAPGQRAAWPQQPRPAFNQTQPAASPARPPNQVGRVVANPVQRAPNTFARPAPAPVRPMPAPAAPSRPAPPRRAPEPRRH